MIPLLLFFVAQQGAPPVVAPAAVAAVTQPLYILDCRVSDTEFSQHSVRFESRGARGYISEGEMRAAEAEFVVAEDSGSVMAGISNFYDNTIFKRYSGQWIDNEVTAEIGETAKFVSARFRDAEDGRASIEISLAVPPLGSASPKITHTGFCVVSEFAQQPLAQAEMEGLTSQ